AMLSALPAADVLPVPPDEPPLLGAAVRPDVVAGSEIAAEFAAPVSPVLVDDDCAVASPELPESASGSRSAVMSPPGPPAASALAMLSPAVRRALPCTVRARRRAMP